MTTITAVHILNYAVSLETCRITTNTQGVWKYKLPLNSLPLKLLAKSAPFMSDLKKMPRQELIREDTDFIHSWNNLTPRYLRIDNAKELTPQEMVDFCSKNDIILQPVVAYKQNSHGDFPPNTVL